MEKLTVIDFESFRPLLEKVNCKERKSKAVRASYDVVMMLKILVLQRLFNLSDDQTEYQITDRMSFSVLLAYHWESVYLMQKQSGFLRIPLRKKK